MSEPGLGARAEALLAIRQGERRDVVAAFTANAGIMAAHTLLETARDATFLAKLPATRLPWMYLAVAVAALVVTEVQRRSTLQARSARAVGVFLLLGGVVTASFALLPATRATLYALYVWTALCASWIAVQLSLVLSGALTVEQAKRLFGLIGAGAVLGAVIGSAVARVLVEFVEPRWLIAVAGALFAVTGLGPVQLIRSGTIEGAPRGRTSVMKGAAGGIVQHTYGRGLLGLLLLATVALTLGDYLFKTRVREAVPTEQLAGFFATVGLGTNVAGLVVQLLLVPWVLRVVGAHGALLVLPVLLAMGAGALAVGSGLIGALVLRGADGSLRYSLHRTALDILYMPLPDVERRRLKPIVEMVGQRGGQCLAALLLLGVRYEYPGLVFAALGVACGGWAVMVLRLRRPYVDLFRDMLERGGAPGTPSLRLDLPALESAVMALNSPRDAEVLLALDLLARQRQGQLVPALILYHPSKVVLEHALELFAQLGRRDALPLVDRLLEHPEREVRTAALRSRMRLAFDEAMLWRYLDDGRCLDQSLTAFVGLVAAGRLPIEAARERQQRWRDAEPEAAVSALARAALARPSPALVPLLLACPRDLPRSARELAEALAAHADPRTLPALFDLLSVRSARSAVRRGLVSLGAPALARLDALMSDPASSHALRSHLPESIRRFPAALAAPILLRHLPIERDGMVRFKLLRSLNRLRRDDPSLPLDRTVIEAMLHRTLSALFRHIELRLALTLGAQEEPARATATHLLLVDLISDKESHALGRAIRLLNLLLPGEDLRPVALGLVSEKPRLRASAVEILTALTPPPYREPLLALVGEMADEARLSLAPPFHTPRALTYEQVIAELMDATGVTLSTLARYHAAELDLAIAPVPSSRQGVQKMSPAMVRLVEEMRRLPASRRFEPQDVSPVPGRP